MLQPLKFLSTINTKPVEDQTFLNKEEELNPLSTRRPSLVPTGSISMTHQRDSTVLKIMTLRLLMTQKLLMLQRMSQELEMTMRNFPMLSLLQKVTIMDSSTRTSKETMPRKL
jgi:hypothetical protein|tara:strand:- start:315 stop:653 length:339 start_codon:yes stop_codon:yes gene_type:complete